MPKTLEFLESIAIFRIFVFCYKSLSELGLQLIYDYNSHK